MTFCGLLIFKGPKRDFMGLLMGLVVWKENQTQLGLWCWNECWWITELLYDEAELLQ